MVAELSRAAGLPVAEIDEWLKRKVIAVATDGKSLSSKDLDDGGWRDLFLALNERLAAYGGGRNPSAAVADAPHRKAQACRSRTVGRNAASLLSSRQRYVLVTLAQLLSMSDEALKSFCRERFGFGLPATRDQANKTINALKPMAIRKHDIPGRVRRALDEARLESADRLFLEDVAAALRRGRQGASVKIGSLPVLLKIFARYRIGGAA